ncbi:SUKH-4 family immunity protein [Streptomyces sp. NPDC059456]|uniref:SUKH-4 family immunity protein n=1 Tax=Streptomyces sp. NPDC059456 TaxID=3346838 RepID=UPI003679C7F2
MPFEDRDAWSPSPAALLEAGAARVREWYGPQAGGGTGREVFTQAEAVFGHADVSRAEYASWLHFAAKVLGHDAYAEQVAADEPGMPWRTVWAWWRPVGAFRAVPNLSGDASAEVFDRPGGPGGPGGRSLLKVWSLWTEERWFDLATGEPCPAPAAGEFTERTQEPGEGEPVLFDPDEDAWALHCPGTWEDPVPLGAGRFLLTEARGVVVVERNAAVDASGWPTGGADSAAWEEGAGEPWFAGPAPGGAPLDAARLEAVFGADWTVRVPPALLPAELTHGPTRELIGAVGLPRHWAAGVTSFRLAWTEQGPPRAPECGETEPGVGGLLHLGTFEMGHADEGEVFVHPRTGAVSMVREGEGPFPLARDTETFVRLLEAVRRFMGACWDPYPAEDGHGEFRCEVAELEPGVLESDDPEEPGAAVWEHVFASITELSVYGY